MARRRAGGSGPWTLIILAVIIAWFTGRSSTPSVVLPNGPAVAERSTPSSIEILRPLDETPTTTAPTAAVAYVTATTLNVRASPGKNAAKLGTLARGDRVTVIEVQDGWATLRLPSGETVWASAEFLSSSPPAAKAPAQPPARAATLGPRRSEAVRRLMEASIQSYGGSCPCPENRDRAGRRCGGRSAWSRAGGARPLCYPSDVTEPMIERYLSRQ